MTTRISRNDLCPCGSGRKYKVCCLHKSFRDDVPRIQRPGADGASLSNYTQQIRFNRIEPEPEPESVTRVELTYVSENGFGTAEVSFAYLLGTPIIMRNGSVLQAELIEPGMQFRLEDGGYATVTHAETPKEYECPSKTSGIVVGKVKYSGHHPRMDMRVSGELIQSTPGHLFWSPTRRAWEPLENFRAGEYLSNRNGDPVRIDWISSIYWEFGDLYNLEVEDAHTYFVGGGDHGGILTHNGLDMGCRVPRAAIAGADIPWSSPAVRAAARQLREGATEITVASRSHAEELFLRMFQGDGFRNTSGWPTAIYKQFGKPGTYHWDDVFENGSRVLRGHFDDGNLHNYVPHLQIHTFDFRTIRILFGT